MTMSRKKAKAVGALSIIADDFDEFYKEIFERLSGSTYVRVLVETIHQPTDEDGIEIVGSFMLTKDDAFELATMAGHLIGKRLAEAGVK